jgi:hypothetical protein
MFGDCHNVLPRAKADPTALHAAGLIHALGYENKEITARYMNKLALNSEEAEQLFSDVKLFLYASSVSHERMVPTVAIDKGWHEFLMYTREYAEYCRSRLGKFVHHVPKSYLSKTTAIPSTFATIEFVGMLSGQHLSANWSAADISGECSDDFDCSSCDSDAGGQDGNTDE